jgi:hypothetical protein
LFRQLSLDRIKAQILRGKISHFNCFRFSGRTAEVTLPVALPHEEHHRIDGRSLRKTGRTVQFATRVSLEFDDKLRRIAQRDKLKLVEVLERALSG